jgi:probable HAF family extracellular repeat protein
MNWNGYVVILCVLFFISCSDQYMIKALPVLGDSSGYALDINNSGDIVGYSMTSAGVDHAALWHEDMVVDLGTLGGASSYALGINDKGTIVGYSETANGEFHAFVWQGGAMIDIDHTKIQIVGSVARAINNNGIIAGEANMDGIIWYAPDNDVWVLDGTGLKGNSDAYDINDNNQVVGWYHLYDEAYVCKDGKIKILPDLGIGRSRAYGINNHGHVVGNSAVPMTYSEQATVWLDDGLPKILEPFEGIYTMSKANDINEYGIIVGEAKKSDNSTVPFFARSGEGVMYELMSLGSGVANSVNNKGVIVGRAINNAGVYKPVKWEPKKVRSPY